MSRVIRILLSNYIGSQRSQKLVIIRTERASLIFERVNGILTKLEQFYSLVCIEFGVVYTCFHTSKI